MYNYKFDVKDKLTLAEALMGDLRETNPNAHKRVSEKWDAIISNIVPDSQTAPTINEFIANLFADYKKEQAN